MNRSRASGAGAVANRKRAHGTDGNDLHESDAGTVKVSNVCVLRYASALNKRSPSDSVERTIAEDNGALVVDNREFF